MKVTNTSTKIIHIGEVTILPDESATVDDSLKSAPAVAMLLSRGDISIGGGKATGKATKASRKGAGGAANTGTPADSSGAQGGSTGGEQ